MKNIKRYYWFVILIIFLLAIILITLNVKGCLNETISSMSLSFTAIILSIIGIALSDPKIPNFKGVVSAKNIDQNRNEQINNHKYLVKFEISNLMEDPIVNFIYKIRYPSVIEFSKSNTIPNIILSNRMRYLTESSYNVLTGRGTEPENKIIVSCE